MPVSNPFDEIQFPSQISLGATGGPTFDTSVLVATSGQEQRNQNWSKHRMRYDVAHGLKTQAELNLLIDFFRARQGRWRAFRFKDWIDYKLNMGTGTLMPTLGAGSTGTNLQTFQLIKEYTDAGGTYTRNISKPIISTIELDTNGASATMGDSAERLVADTGTVAVPNDDGDFTVDSSGLLTWRDNSDAGSALGGGTPGVTTDYSFTPNPRPGSVGQSIYITGETGTGAGIVNNKRWVIIAAVGSSITINADTDGFTLTGTPAATIEPVTAETMVRARGYEYDVPVRFDVDEMEAQIEFYETHNWRGIQLVEVRL